MKKLSFVAVVTTSPPDATAETAKQKEEGSDREHRRMDGKVCTFHAEGSATRQAFVSGP
jgi:hypothetical protein